MKAICKIILLYIFISTSLFTFGQQCNPDLGTKTLYKNPEIKTGYSPQGFSPVFINHVGRHGARHLTKEVTASVAYKLLRKADSTGMLSENGKRLKMFLIELDKIEKGNVKSISLIGESEQQGIARRMYEQDKKVFESSSQGIKVMITKEIRTKQTANAFLSELKNIPSAISLPSYITNDTILRFYDLSPAYLQFEKEGYWKKDLEKLKVKLYYHHVCYEITKHFFNENFANQLSIFELQDFVSDLFGFISILPSIQQEIVKNRSGLTADSIKQFFNCGELSVLSKVADAEDYLLKGPGTNINGIQVIIAAPLLMDFIISTDNFLSGGKPAINLRFTHAEAIAPFAALLGLKNTDREVKAITAFEKAWKASGVIPLSANIQWILYKDEKSKNYFIKFLLNENEVSVTGLKTNSFPYYKWTEVRKFYLTKLQQLHLDLTDNSYQYLLKVK